MNSRDCPHCGAEVGQPHAADCDIERCTVCEYLRINCDCKDHEPLKAAWTGECPYSDSEWNRVDRGRHRRSDGKWEIIGKGRRWYGYRQGELWGQWERDAVGKEYQPFESLEAAKVEIDEHEWRGFA